MPADRAVVEALEVLEGACLLDVEALATAVGNHVGVEIHAARLDTGLAQQAEELASAGAEIEHGGGLAKVLDIGQLPLPHALGRPAHAALEGEVVGDRTRRKRRRRRGRAALSPLQPGKSLLDLEREARLVGEGVDAALQLLDESGERVAALLERHLAGVDALGETVGEPQHRRVEPALVSRERLDVPAHELAQSALGRRQEQAAQPAPGPRPREEGPLGADSPERLGLASLECEGVDAVAAEVALAPLHLQMKAREDRLVLGLLGQALLRHLASVGTTPFWVALNPSRFPALPGGSRDSQAAAPAGCGDSQGPNSTCAPSSRVSAEPNRAGENVGWMWTCT